VDLAGRDPDAGFTGVPYTKGMLFLRSLEKAFGRPEFDAFLRGYFDHFAFQSITTADFLDYLKQHLLQKNPEAAARVPVEQWVFEPGLPDSAAYPESSLLSAVDAVAEKWLSGQLPTSGIPAAGWVTQQWLRFLRALPEDISRERLADLDRAFHLTRTGNSEIVSQWLLMGVRAGYEPAYPRLEEFLATVGRRKFLKPLYTELAKTPEGKQRARTIYDKARPLYHPITVTTIDETLKEN
jgi:hypothetical protein